MSGHYWYETAPSHVVRVLDALRDYRAAEQAMRRRIRESMKMGETDLRALRFLLKAEAEGRLATPADLGAHLGMKSSSITIMLDRLTESGHVSRRPHPSDRRSITVTATPGADEEVRHTVGLMHERMLEAAAGLGDAEAETVGRFLTELTDVMDGA